jgi:hypothetical protein
MVLLQNCQVLLLIRGAVVCSSKLDSAREMFPGLEARRDPSSLFLFSFCPRRDRCHCHFCFYFCSCVRKVYYRLPSLLPLLRKCNSFPCANVSVARPRAVLRDLLASVRNWSAWSPATNSQSSLFLTPSAVTVRLLRRSFFSKTQAQVQAPHYTSWHTHLLCVRQKAR